MPAAPGHSSNDPGWTADPVLQGKNACGKSIDKFPENYRNAPVSKDIEEPG